MAQRTNTPWLSEGPLRKRFRVEQGHLVTELNQPDRNLIMDQIQDERRGAERQDFLGGYKVGSVPLVDLERVKKAYPDLFAGDAETKKKALIRFSNDPAMSEFLIKRA